MMKIQKNLLNFVEIKFILSPRDLDQFCFSMLGNQKEMIK